MVEKTDSFQEWSRNPGYFCDYGDYVKHVQNAERMREKATQDQIAEKTAQKVYELLKNEKRQ